MAISADIKLAIYNGALLRLGSRKIATLSEDRKPRRTLDHFWGGSNEIVGYALERGDWNFALRARQLEPDTAVETQFGWTHAYQKPDDFARLSALSGDERFKLTLTHEGYADEAGYWLTDHSPLYVRYVSNDSDYGYNSGAWTKGFRDYLEIRLAALSCQDITNDGDLMRTLMRAEEKALKNAKSVDAMQEGTKFLPSGSWTRSRSARFGYNRDRSTSLP